MRSLALEPGLRVLRGLRFAPYRLARDYGVVVGRIAKGGGHTAHLLLQVDLVVAAGERHIGQHGGIGLRFGLHAGAPRRQGGLVRRVLHAGRIPRSLQVQNRRRLRLQRRCGQRAKHQSQARVNHAYQQHVIPLSSTAPNGAPRGAAGTATRCARRFGSRLRPTYRPAWCVYPAQPGPPA